MHHPTPHWSQTSSQLLRACPRAWALTYGQSDTPFSSTRLNAQRLQRPRTALEGAVRALRATWIERLKDHFLGKIWSPRYRMQRTRIHLEDALMMAGIESPPAHVDMAVGRAHEQLRRLEDTLSLRPVFSSHAARWAYFERWQSAQLHGVELYAAPDVAVYHQHKWVLVRIQFRSPTHPPFSQQLEHLLMVHWAMAQPGFPNEPDAYSVKVVRWNRSRWLEHHLAITSTLLDQALSLVHHDRQEMQWLLRSTLADPQLTSIPLASEERTCDGCHHRTGCPAKDGLAKARLFQERALRAFQSDETKSANTA